MHNFITEFVKILDIFKEFAGNRVNELGNIRRRGVGPKFSDLEVIALSATAEAYGIDSENYLFKRLERGKGQLLPNLITRRRYNQRRKQTARFGEKIRKEITRAIDGNEYVFSGDSKPVKVCQNVRAGRCAMGKDNFDHASAWGYCSTMRMKYYGYKLHAVCGISGVIHSYNMAPENVHDIHYLKDIQWEYHDYMILGDKGYLNAKVPQNLFDVAKITLEVPYRLNQKNWRPPIWALRRSRNASRLFSRN